MKNFIHTEHEPVVICTEMSVVRTIISRTLYVAVGSKNDNQSSYVRGCR